MREIKFKMYYKDKLIEELSLEEIAYKCEFHWCKEVKVCQYTGLNDKSGKEIYEGDILRLGNSRRVLWQVIWKDSIPFSISLEKQGDRTVPVGFFLKIITIRATYPQYIHPDTSEMEIIGNIYENSELISSQTPRDAQNGI